MLCLVHFSMVICLLASPSLLEASQQEAIFAGGCFWCLEHDLEDLSGVYSAESGYTGGDLSNPNYGNHKGHQEAVIVSFDSEKITYQKLLRSFWRNIDPFDGGGQFCDRGDSYRPVIFFENSDEKNEASKSLLSASKELGVDLEKINVEIKPKSQFWEAEVYHQDFANRNELKYKFYRFSCGRDQQLDKLWKENARTINVWSE